MSMQYPVLGNRPINQWKVVELKEELKRRNLPLKGLKDDLIKRLDEAIRSEKGPFTQEASNIAYHEPEPGVQCEGAPSMDNSFESADDIRNDNITKTSRIDDDIQKVDDERAPAEVKEVKVQEKEAVGGSDGVGLTIGETVPPPSIGTSIMVNEVVVTQIACTDGASEKNETEENVDSKLLNKDAVTGGEQEALEALVENTDMINDSKSTQITESDKPMQNNEIKMEHEHPEPLQHAELNSTDPTNQVHEVSPSLGIQVKYESFSTKTVSVCEKNELKDNFNVDNDHLELNVVKPEIIKPSSSRGSADDNNLHTLNDEKPHVDQGIVEPIDNNKSKCVDFSYKIDRGYVGSSTISKPEHNMVDDFVLEDVENKPIDVVHNSIEARGKIVQINLPVAKENRPVDSAGLDLSLDKMETSAEGTAPSEEKKFQGVDNERIDMTDEGPLEKINLEPSSADDSMEEDALETKQIDSNSKSVEVAKVKTTEVSDAEVGGNAVASESGLDDKMELSSKTKDIDAPEKRKFQAVGENKEPSKKQRRLKPGSLNIPGTESTPSLSSEHKDLFQATASKRSITRSDSTISGDVSKERVVPPSPKSPTTSLRIDHFLRPFTLKAVQELLAQTGNICSFWMDQIKTHCYVTYSSVDEAIMTRNAVYNLQWPPNGGRLLIAEFVDPQEVKLRLEAPAQSPGAPLTSSPTVPAAQAPVQPSPSPRLVNHPVPQAQVKQPPPSSDTPKPRERLPVPPPPLPEPPIVTLDDLFRKTKATPRIYYLPLTDEQVATKLTKQKRK